MKSSDEVRLGILRVQKEYRPAQSALVIDAQPGSTGVLRTEPIQEKFA